MPSRSGLFAKSGVGGPVIIADIEQHPGNVFFVNSVTGTNAAGYGRNPDAPLASIAYAFSSALVAAGDVVYVMPAHVETIATAGGITANIAGVRVIGLGWGANRPTLTWSAEASSILITAASVEIKNIRTKVSIDEVVSMIAVSAADVVLDAVDFIDTANAQAIQFLLTTAAADRLTVKNCHHEQVLAAPTANSEWIQLVGINGGWIVDNFFHLLFTNAAASITISGSTACIGVFVGRNVIVQRGGTTQVSAILFVDGSTGTYAFDNRVACTATGITTGIDVGSAGYAGGNVNQNDPDKSGIVTPGVDS